MAGIDDAYATAARRILNMEDLVFSESGGANEKVAAVLQAFYSLAQLTPESELPEALIQRVNQRLRPITATDETEAHPGRQKSGGRPGGTWRKVLLRRFTLPMATMILLLAALVVSLTANVLLSRREPFRPEAAIHLDGTDSAPLAQAVYLFDGQSAVVHASGLAELTSGYRYVAWAELENGFQPLGTLTMLSRSDARLAVEHENLPSAVVVTIEPTSTPASPSGPQVLTGSLR